MALSDDGLKGRFANLRSIGHRIEQQSITPHPEAPESMMQSARQELKDRLAQQPRRNVTVRMSVEMPKEMHDQVTEIAARSGLAKAEVVRQILAEVIPEIL